MTSNPTSQQPHKSIYPRSHKSDTIDNYHGTWVRDPYRWLEDPHAPETQAWGKAQNDLTFDFLRKVPAFSQIKTRLTQVWDYEKYSVPGRRGNRYFFSKNDGLQNQSVLYWQEGLQGKPRELLDPNQFSKDGTVAFTGGAISKDGELLAYATSKGGSDWQEIRVRQVESGEDYSEVLQWCKFTSMAWHPDNSGFYYNRFPDPTGKPDAEQYLDNRIYFHRVGMTQSEDKLIFEHPDNREFMVSPYVTEGGDYLVITVTLGTDRENRVYYQSLANDGGAVIRLLDEGDASYGFVGENAGIFFFRTDHSAPNGRLIGIDLNKPNPANWHEIIPETDQPISFMTIVNNQFVVAYLEDAHHVIKIYELDGALASHLPLPTLGSITGLSGKREDDNMFLGFSSFLYPNTIFQYDFNQQELIPFRVPELDFDTSHFVTTQVFATSKDGSKVPMFLTHKKELNLDGNNPTLLYGYGGFRVDLTPQFVVSATTWLEAGGVFAMVNLRGGNEYGEKWHNAGMLHNKQNVFDDFISASEWLVANGYTSAKRLAIQGGSNGGLLVAAAMIQRPDLFGAVICQVPVIDMLRYHKFTMGKYWIGEYGNAEENPEHFDFLYAYSPLHNVKEGETYPPTLIVTADTDDRVVPAHAKKFAATLQEKDSGQNPILIRIETKAGHGAGKPTAKIIEEQADIYAFLWHVFEMGK